MFRGRISCSKPQRRAVARWLTLATLGNMAHHGWMFLLTLIQGLSAGLRLQESALYRYPYRVAEEAIRGDAKRIAVDIDICLERLYE